MEILKDSRDRDRFFHRVRVIGLPMEIATPLWGEISKWLTNNGIDWTISRLKDLKTSLIKDRAKQEPVLWLKRNSSGDIAGPVGALFRWSRKHDLHFARSVQVLMYYTNWVYTNPTASQIEKFEQGVKAIPVNLQDIGEGLGQFVKQTVTKPKRVRPGSHLWLSRFASTKKCPLPNRAGSVNKTAPVSEDLLIFQNDSGYRLYFNYKRIVTPVIKGTGQLREMQNRTYHPAQLQSRKRFMPSDFVCGRISFIQEPGGKLRSVANPFRILNTLLEPLSDHLYSAVRSLPWDCTFDQSKPNLVLFKALKEKTKVYSVDLSSATDRFPLDLQVNVLKALVHPRDHDFVNLWSDFCRGRWRYNNTYITWTKGQPLGMQTSFAAFALTHGFLLYFLLWEIQREHCEGACPGWNGEFFILGDDVVILNERLFRSYRKTLEILECPVSESKSIVSNDICEFAGKLYTNGLVIPQMKWKGISDDNFLDICRLLGRKSRSLLSSRQKAIFDRVANCYGGIGLNFSLPGDNLTKMVQRSIENGLLADKDDFTSRLMELRRSVHKELYESRVNPGMDHDTVEALVATFDEKVLEQLEKTCLHDATPFMSLVNGLSTLVGSSRNTVLPLALVDPAKLSLLQRLERYFNVG